MAEAPLILQTEDLTKHFGAIPAAEGLNIGVEQRELVGIVGPNGSGKTTFLNLVTGYLKPGRGRILFLGRDTTGLPPRVITKLGMARSFQIPQLYMENERAGEHASLPGSRVRNRGQLLVTPHPEEEE